MCVKHVDGVYRVTEDDSCTQTIDYGTCEDQWHLRGPNSFCYYCYVMITNVICVLYP